MKYTQGKYLILSKKTLAKEIYDLTILCPDVAEVAVAGQFVNVKVDGFMLRRPISICSIDKNKGTLRIIFEVRGEGTKVMSQLAEGAMIDIVAPLGGCGFEMDGHETAVIIGGGIGNPPMLAVAENFGKNATVISGYRNTSAVILQEDFAATGAETILCTDDGSAGRKGFVTDALKEVLASKKPDVIYACGPNVMLRRIIEIAKENGGSIRLTEDAMEGTKDVDVVYTDVWVSMGEPDEVWAERIEELSPYQVNKAVMDNAGKEAIFLHCLPAFHDLKTGIGQEIEKKFGISEMEVTDEVFESSQSLVFEEAENRMHTIKAVMAATLGYNG